MKSVVIVLGSAVLIVGCGGGTNSGPECGPSASCLPPQLNPAESILGLWDRSGVQDSRQEILYTYIGAEGEYYVYDFQQDDFGSGENCHTLDIGFIYRITESSNYTIEFRTSESDVEGLSIYSASIFRQGNNLDVRIPEVVIEKMWTPTNGLTRDDLVLCQ